MATDAPSNTIDLVEAGRGALERGAWEDARGWFERAVAVDETASGLEGLALAAWWLNDAATTRDARERAHRRYRQQGDRRGAARLALLLAWDAIAFHGEAAVASGWMQRARRLLAEEPEAAEHCLLLIREGEIALYDDHDPPAARRHAARAAALAHTLGDNDLEANALSLEGVALVSAGDIPAGMRLLDEATTAAIVGDMTDLNQIGVAYCRLIDACERVRDFDRAAQWCERLEEFSRRWRMDPLHAFCRAQYASILIWRGLWAEAERELIAAQRELAATHPGHLGETLLGLSELRRRQGRWDEAAALLANCGHGPAALAARAALDLDRDDLTAARAALDRALRQLSPDARAERAVALELAVETCCRLGDRAAAAAAAAELRAVARAIGTNPLRAAAAVATGLVAAANGEAEQAEVCLGDAIDRWRQVGAPYEAACAQLALARAAIAHGRVEAGKAEAAAARATFDRLGAAAAVARADALLDAAQAKPSIARPAAASSLTQRERDVLTLIADGLSDREIAGRLGLSKHTIHRHVANILTKLDLPSRAAAVAHASRHGYL